MHTYRIVTGDWSDDGHGKTDFFTVKTSHKMEEIQQAYRNAVQKSGVALDNNKGKGKFQICCEYENNTIPAEAVKLLTELGVTWDEMENEFDDDGSLCACGKDVAIIFMEMVKTQIEGFEYKFAKKPPCLNGFWGKLNIQMGYGCY